MIAKAIPMKTAVKSHFAKLVAYITDDQDTPFRLGAVNITNCYGDEVEDAVFEVLNTQLKNQRAVSDKTYHLIVSFRAGEEPSAETLQAIENEICAGLGFKDHQRVSAVHCDTENLHVHIAINKVHPSKHTIHKPFQDYKTLAKLCAKLEQQYGLEVDKHSTQRNHTAGRARDMEAHAGIESLMSWIQQNALAQIKQANSWEALHIVLYENGLSIKLRGNGLAISTIDGALGVKASSVDRDCSKKQLEQRFGSFQPANEQALKAIKVKQRYKRSTLINNSAKIGESVRINDPAKTISAELFSVYQAQMADKTANRNDAIDKARAQHKDQIQQAKDKAAHKRRWIKALIQPGINKKFLLGLISKSLQVDIKQKNADYKYKRQRLYRQHTRQSWLDWLQQQAKQGNNNALQLLRQRHVNNDQRGNYIVKSKYNIEEKANPTQYDPSLPKARVTKQGTVFYLHDKAVIKDDGNRFHLASNANQEVLTTALIHAKQRHGYQLSVEGNELFQENVVRASVKAGLNISFDQDHLERRRVQLSAEMHLFGDGALRNVTQQQSRGMRR
ncbi:MAG: relaxase/mobilization nuclease domain-containing protein [Methylococcaceae bacterium]|nr:relaxase/mobilization nuclease domain-containing protein [Methylococcaceae bacterium]